MRHSRARLATLALSLSTLLFAGCSILTTGTEPEFGATDAARVAENIGHVQPSRKDTCETQKRLAAQSSRIDAYLKDKSPVYKPAPCEQAKPPAEPVKPEAKTS